MITEVNVWLFNIAVCGYYDTKRANKNNPAVFGQMGSTLNNIEQWCRGQRLVDTSTYKGMDGHEIPQTYFLCLETAQNGDYLLGLWNRLHTHSNQISSVGVDDVIGQVRTETTDIDDDRIPGYATYFYVMPQAGRVACIRVKHPLNGLSNFTKYVYSFLTSVNPQHVVLGEPNDNGDIVVRGYKPRQGDEEPTANLRARFRLSTIPRIGESDYITENSHLIHKVITKTTINTALQEERRWWQTGLALLGLGAKVEEGGPTGEVVIKSELPMTFTREEITQVIEEWQQRQNDDFEAEDDIGFCLRGETSARWLSKSYARRSFQLDIDWIDDEQVDAQGLLEKLIQNRAAILAMAA